MNTSEISENDLCMLEQLTYLDGDVIALLKGMCKAPGARLTEGMKQGVPNTIKDYIEELGFTDDVIEELKKDKETKGCINPSEWANILEYLKSDKFADYKIDKMYTRENVDKVDAICFVRESEPDAAIVAFRGTLDASEWRDNMLGLTMPDTPDQIAAYNFIEGLPYNNITVAGHSKGGNKAMYVAVRSDKVSRCVSFDGQGFSDKFIKKYQDEIELRQGKIKNYSVSTDYVHALMLPVGTQIYCEGYGIENVKQHHSPDSFFKKDENGDLVFKNGEPEIVTDVEEDIEAQTIHKFMTFIIYNVPDEEKEEIIGLINEILYYTMGSSEEDGSIDWESLYKCIAQNPETFEKIIAYILKYAEVNNLGLDDLLLLFKTILFPNMSMEDLKAIAGTIISGTYAAYLSAPILVRIILAALLSSGKDNPWVGMLFKLLSSISYKRIKEYKDRVIIIPPRVQIGISTSETRDFSVSCYNSVSDRIRNVDSKKYPRTSRWNQYLGNYYIDKTDPRESMTSLEDFSRIHDRANADAKKKLEELFKDVEEIDAEYERKISNLNTEVKHIVNKINSLL